MLVISLFGASLPTTPRLMLDSPMPLSFANLFRLPNLSTAIVVGLTMICGQIIIRYVAGMADRKRAENEKIPAVDKVNDAIYLRLNDLLDRLANIVDMQEQKIQAQSARLKDADERMNAQGERIRNQEERISELERELLEARALHAQAEKAALGELRDVTQTEISTLALLKAQATDTPAE